MTEPLKMTTQTIALPDKDKQMLKDLAIRFGLTQVRKGRKIANVSALLNMLVAHLKDDPDVFFEWLKGQLDALENKTQSE